MGAKRIAITCGDPAGVGPELIGRMAESIASEFSEVEFTVIGPKGLFELPVGFKLIDVGSGGVDIECGKPSIEGAKIALEAMELAAAGSYDAVVTGPISKDWCVRAGFLFPGQTEFFADRWGGVPTMGFVGERLRVVLATWHIPLSEVPAKLNAKTLSLAIERSTLIGGGRDCRIAVCGLNPHAGENGVLGHEEKDWIDPLLENLRTEYPGLSRCLPADTVFHRMLKGDFEVIVALYHDQGLGPLKTVEFDSAVNVTLGLPIVRTSPDHGTAYDIAGKGLASRHSFENAVRVAVDLCS